MKTFRLLSLVFAMTALASPSQAGEFHLPADQLNELPTLFVLWPILFARSFVGVAKVKPVRSVLKVLFF